MQKNSGNNMQKNSSFILKAGPLLLILFIDGMGLGLVIPVLNGLIFDVNSTFLPKAAYSALMYNLIYGGIIGIFMLCWFFGAAILGDLSDHIGRKKSLIICLVGTFLGYILSGISVSLSSIALLLLGRVIAGFTSGSQPIAQAAIVDLSTPETKARNIGYILLSLSIGFIVGPLLGGILADNRLVSWFDFSTPFYFAALVSLLNIFLLLWLFEDTYVSKSTTFKINPYQAINIFISAFKNESVRVLSILLFMFIFGWSSFYTFISLYLLKIHQFSPAEISFYMAVMGIGFGVGNGFLANYLAKLFPLMNIFIYSTLITAIMAIFILWWQSPLFDWMIIAPLGAAVSVAYVGILTSFSDQVDETRQGWVMGITGSVMAFVWGVNGVTLGLLATWSAVLPIVVAAVSLLITVMCTIIFFKNPVKNKTLMKN